MNKKELMIETLKNRVLNSLNERDNPKGKPGESWFYEPFNNCLRNTFKDIDVDGFTTTYKFKDDKGKLSFDGRVAPEDKAALSYTPPLRLIYGYTTIQKRFDGQEVSPDNFYWGQFKQLGKWWCDKNTGKLTIQMFEDKSLPDAHPWSVKSLINKPSQVTTIPNKGFSLVPKITSSGAVSSKSLPQAKTMEDVKNGNGYIIKGMMGPVVKLLQKMLLKLDYDLGPQKDDGVFGEKTEDAVEKFQKDFNIKPKNNVYGIFGSITLNKMIEKLKEIK